MSQELLDLMILVIQYLLLIKVLFYEYLLEQGKK